MYGGTKVVNVYTRRSCRHKNEVMCAGIVESVCMLTGCHAGARTWPTSIASHHAHNLQNFSSGPPVFKKGPNSPGSLLWYTSYKTRAGGLS